MHYDPMLAGCRCDVCPLRGTGAVIPPEGNLTPKLVVVGDAPGPRDVESGRPFFGAGGVKLAQYLASIHLTRADVWLTNAVLCLEAHTKLRFADGSTPTIREVVANRLSGPVLSALDPFGGVEPREIVDWHQSSRAGRRMFKLTTEHAKQNREGRITGPILTEDHLVLTERGWLPVCDVGGEMIATGYDAFYGAAHDVVIGSMLGDGSITRSNLRVSHRSDFEDYLLAKASVFPFQLYWDLRRMTAASPSPQSSFLTPALPWLRPFRRQWYEPRRIPRDLKLTRRALAVMFFDNGYTRFKDGRCCGSEIATNRFERDDVEFLAQHLRQQFGLEVNVRYGSGWRLQFPVVGSRKLSELVAPYAVDSLLYKLWPEHRGVARVVWAPDDRMMFYDRAAVFEVFPRERSVYCISVAGHSENFATIGAIVHNCRTRVPDSAGRSSFSPKTFMAWLKRENIARRKAGAPELIDPFTACYPRLQHELKRADAAARAAGMPNGVVVMPFENFAMGSVFGVPGKSLPVMKYRGSVITEADAPVMQKLLMRGK